MTKGNPRYAAYLRTTEAPTNWDFMAFIDGEKASYCGDAIEGHIHSHEAFTAFIDGRHP